GDGRRGDTALGLAVAGLVSEAVNTVEVQRRHVNQGAVAVQSQRAVARAVDQDRAERVAVYVAIVGEHARSGHGELGVFRCGVAVVVGRHWRVIDRRHGDGRRGDTALGLAVAGLVGE